MISKKVTVKAETGLHARPVSELVQLVKSFASTKVTLASGARTVNAGSILSILSLGLKKGTEIEVSADGGDEAAAVQAVVDFIENVKD